jgi:hypothetical protein
MGVQIMATGVVGKIDEARLGWKWQSLNMGVNSCLFIYNHEASQSSKSLPDIK